MTKNVVGLFGTCGNSKWRDIAIPLLEVAGIEYFNPVVEDWNEKCVIIEAEHAANDKVIMLVITGETMAIGSMAESGWIALQAHLRDQKLIVVLDDMNPEPDPSLRINKIRNLMRGHINALPENESIKICATVEEATNLAISIIKS